MRDKLRQVAFALGFVLVVVAAGTALAERRVALVIGNDRYENVAPLKKAVGDAKAFAGLLRSKGFDRVLERQDLTQRGMAQAIADFIDAIHEGDTAVFVYSGHGWSDGAQNFLVGVDAPKEGSESLMKQVSFPLRNGANGILDEIDRKGARLKVAIVDACRDYPFRSDTTGKSLGQGRGLVRVEPPKGTFVVFSAGTGQVALDRLAEGDADPNSVFTRVFVPLLASGMTLQGAIKEAQERVVALARTINHDQQPAYYDEVLGPTCIAGSCSSGSSAVAPPPPPSPPPAPTPSQALVDAGQVWATTQASTSVAVLGEFIEKYRGTPYAGLAAARLAELQKLAALPPVNSPAGGSGPGGPAAVCTGGVVASVGGAGVAAAARRCLRPKEVFRDCPDICPEMVVVPPGRFTMGSPASEKGRETDEGPQHEVTIGAAFAVGKLEVTRGQFAAFVNDSGYKPGDSCFVIDAAGKWADTKGKSFRDPSFRQDDTHPAVCVSWDAARAYVSWLSRKTGKPYRLLSEAEWEYAGRAGTTTPYWFGSDVNSLCGYANGADATAKARFPAWTGAATCQDNHVFTAPGGSFAANDFGLFDMAGNVWEWTEDCWHDSYNGAPRDGSAWTTGDYTRRVLRGGSWYIDPGLLRAAFRSGNSSGNRSDAYGLRVARTLTP